MTYKTVAKYLGSKSGQAIGQALCKNIFASVYFVSINAS